MRLWMLLSGTIVAAAVMGVSLGAYVTNEPVVPLTGSAEAAAVLPEAPLAPLPASSAFGAEADTGQGPVEIHCKGCGPTLAQRRWLAETAPVEPEPPEPLIDHDLATDALGRPDIGLQP